MRLLIGVLLVAAAGIGWADEYRYPINDPFLATVVGTPEQLRAKLPEDFKLKIRHLPKTKNWKLPEAMWYAHRLEYSYRLQPHPAPMIFLIAGTGGYHDTGKNLILLKAFYQAGFHVVGITSPTHSEFVIAASTTGLPGEQRDDAADIYRVMQQIADEIGHKDRITGYDLAGYSLGGSNAAFVAELDSREKAFDFDKVLLIEPPLSIYSSISKLDLMLQNIPGGVDNFHRFFARVVNEITAAYKNSSTVEFSPELVFDVFKTNPPTREELGALIGIAFRLSSSSMMFASDLRTNFGFIKPDNVILTKNSSLGVYGQVAVRVGFTDYYHEFFWPFYEPSYPEATRESFAQEQSLASIRSFLEHADNVAVFHNHNDLILTEGQIDFFPEVFGDRATIFPNGGHMGNLDYPYVLDRIVGYFQ
jgi:pimeloyl-ACP methyl ester carboxylesterase